MAEKIKNHKDLRVWRLGIEIVKKVYVLTDGYPKRETYGLSSQTQRAAVSIPANIAEGFGRHHAGEHRQFYNISLGSCTELDTLIIIAKEIGYLKEKQGDELSEMIDHESRMINKLIRKIV